MKYIAARRFPSTCLALLTLSLVCFSHQTAKAQEANIEFSLDVQPIFAKKCFSCHGPGESEGGLRLDSKEGAFAELDSGSRGVIPGKPAESELLRRITTDDESERMPPEGKPLSPAEIKVMRTWIKQGAQWQGHWAFEPMKDHEPPKVKQKDWVNTPIDSFILGQLESAGFKPNPQANRVTLIRRAYYNLTGLPPTAEQVKAFEQDKSPKAYENLIDQLLTSERYGERWARHWLDVVRFAETNSFERDGVKPNAWRYRDYVIDAFNKDKPYNQFIIEQMAGDELPDATNETIIATGFHRLGLWDDEPADRLLHLYNHYDDIVTTTGQSFLGLTINCARCHDHKIDPILQSDYYSFLAFFRGMKPYGIGRSNTSSSQYEISTPEVIAAYSAHDNRVQEQQKKIDEIFNQAIETLPKAERGEARVRGRKKIEKKMENYVPNRASEFSELQREMASIKEQVKYLGARQYALAVNLCDNPPPKTNIMQRGNPHVPGDEVEPRFPTMFGMPAPELPDRTGEKTSGRRTVLANWIASDDNFLTARVMVNRIWQHHFGRGIVRSTNNFGQLGTPPTHPQLLDWLALDFVQNGWSMKKLHKKIMMSSVYQLSSQASEKELAADPNNELFWRYNMRRLSAEEIRDSILAVNGRLNLKMYGPGIYTEISKEVKAGQSVPGKGWGNSKPEERARRSVYIHVKRSLIDPMLANFDFPDTDTSCPDRFTTLQPSQALGMLNGKFLNDQAKVLADRLREESGEKIEKQVADSIQVVFGRDATAEDIKTGLDLINTMQEKHNVDKNRALDLYCLMILNLNEFMFLD
ncbi:MAG: hypothetical protein COA78_34565 [Blastopirellula sp.]|nr:MAG: hypothetical protein COA78_34565 [Blastopirellula sp.]